MIFHNPVLPGFYPDPSVCRANGKYYLACSSFEFYPGVPLFESDDLVHWRPIGHALTAPAQARLAAVAPSRGIWAPTLRWHDGLFYLATVNMDGGGNFFVTARDPRGPWSDPVYVPMKSIDPSLFFEDGKLYFMTPQTKTPGAVRGIYMAQIDPATGRLLTGERLLWQGSGGKCLEAPHLYHIGDYYYLMAAEGGTEYGHGITIARSRALWGPYDGCPDNPIVTNRDDHDNPLQCAGHGDLVETPDGGWAMVLLASRWGSKWHSHIGRETCLLPLHWQDGWPRPANGGRCLHEQEDAAWLTAPAAAAAPGFCLDTRAAHWDRDFAFLRQREPGAYRPDPETGGLTLRGGAPLSTSLTPVWIGHRQQLMQGTCSVQLAFDPPEGAEAGLTLYLSPHYHFDLAARRQGGQAQLLLRQTAGPCLSAVTACVPLPAGPLTLTVQATPTRYRFSAADGRGMRVELGEAETRLLSNELAKLFTGVFFGLYCQDPAGRAEASFTQFRCVPQEL